MRRVDPPGRVQPRRDAEGDLFRGGGGAWSQSRLGQQGPQAGGARIRQRRQAPGRDRPVLPLQRDEVRDGAQAATRKSESSESATPARRAMAWAIFIAIPDAANSRNG